MFQKLMPQKTGGEVEFLLGKGMYFHDVLELYYLLSYQVSHSISALS